jgi:hypothetical protein
MWKGMWGGAGMRDGGGWGGLGRWRHVYYSVHPSIHPPSHPINHRIDPPTNHIYRSPQSNQSLTPGAGGARGAAHGLLRLSLWDGERHGHRRAQVRPYMRVRSFFCFACRAHSMFM